MGFLLTLVLWSRGEPLTARFRHPKRSADSRPGDSLKWQSRRKVQA
jgi:hypothetical protein